MKTCEDIIPKIGMGATMFIGDAARPYRIVDIISCDEILIQMDKTVELKNGEHVFYPNKKGQVHSVKNVKGEWKVGKSSKLLVHLGYQAYYD